MEAYESDTGSVDEQRTPTPGSASASANALANFETSSTGAGSTNSLKMGSDTGSDNGIIPAQRMCFDDSFSIDNASFPATEQAIVSLDNYEDMLRKTEPIETRRMEKMLAHLGKVCFVQQ